MATAAESVRSTPRTVLLAATILEQTTKIESYLQENGIPSPSFEPGATPKLPLSPELETCLGAALSALDELSALLMGPMAWLRAQIDHAYDMVSLHALYRHQIPNKFGVNEEISIADIAIRCGHVDTDILARLLQHAVTNRLLGQPRPGYIAHSAISAMLADSPPLMDWVGASCEDIWPAAPRVIDALAKWPGPPLPNQAAHNLAENTSVPYFQTLARNPDRARRLASAMSVMQSMPGWEPAAALDAYDWGALGDAVVVDVGGSNGAFAASLAEKYELLNVVVQDLPDVIASAHVNSARVTLQVHDFFTPQPVHGADIYFLRQILHDWPDAFAMQILQGLVPALKPGARVIINDHCLPAPGTTSRLEEWQARCQDLVMMAMFHGKERAEAEWNELITSADPRFRLVSVTRLPPGPLALIEVVWEPV